MSQTSLPSLEASARPGQCSICFVARSVLWPPEGTRPRVGFHLFPTATLPWVSHAIATSTRSDFLPDSPPSGNKQHYNLQLTCFDSWADPETVQEREKHSFYGGLHRSASYLSRCGTVNRTKGAVFANLSYLMHGYNPH